MNYGRAIGPITLRTAAALLFAMSTAPAQEFDALPLEGAPLAHPGPYEVVREPAFGSPGHIAFRPASLDRFPREDMSRFTSTWTKRLG
jgi:hypothetical protein